MPATGLSSVFSVARDDLYTGWRALRRSPRVTFAAGTTLALALAATVTTFAVVDGVLLRALPIPDEERVLGLVHTRVDRGGHYGVPYHSYMGWRDGQRSFESIAVVRGGVYRLADADGTERIEGTEVSPQYFDVLGVSAAHGRTLEPGDFAPDADKVVVLADRLWQTRFGGDPSVVGRSIELEGLRRTVVGIMPPAHEHWTLRWRSLWLPLEVDEAEARVAVQWGFSVLARLAPDVTIDAARADLEAVSRRLEEEFPTFNRGWTVEMHPVRWWLDEHVRGPLLSLQLAVVLVLLLACANVGNLFLAQATVRRRELTVRAALGASRKRLRRQLVTEGLLLGWLAGLVGLALSYGAAEALRALASPHLPRSEEIRVDAGVVAVALGASLVAGALSALLPAVHSTGIGGGQLVTDRGGVEAGEGRRWRRLLVSVQVALALTVGVAALLLGRSVHELGQVDPGWQPDGVLAFRLELPESEPPGIAESPEGQGEAAKLARIEKLRELGRRLGALPGVDEVAFCGTQLPLLDGQGAFELFVEGQPRSETPEVVVTAGAVSPDYFSTMGIERVDGEPFPPDATWESSRAVVVSKSFADEFFDGRAVGRWVEWRSGDRGTIVGVVRDVQQVSLTRSSERVVYLPWGRAPRSQAVVLRTSLPEAALRQPIESTIEELAPGTTTWDFHSGEEIVRGSYSSRRFMSVLFAAFAGLALILGALGVYAVVAFATATRRREMAVRQVCGARRAQVVAQVVFEGMVPVWAGLGLGVLGALALGRMIEAELFAVSAHDPVSLVTAVVVLAGVAVAASVLPARRAGRIQPAEALRHE